MEELFADLDNKRVQRGYTTEERLLQRFLDRQARSSKESKKIRKHGAGYCSGRFAGSAVDPTPCSIEELEDEGLVMNAKLPDTQCVDVDVNISLARCGACEELELGSDEDIGDVPVGKLKWIQCDLCDVWFHYVCVGVLDFDSDDEWFCAKCLE